MAKKAIFESQLIQFSTYDAEVGGYVYQITPASFTLEAGQSYVIEWDGEEYPSTAIPYDSFAPGAVTIGMGEAPVAVGYLASTDYIGFLTSASGEHTVGIYEVIEDPGIVIKNRFGKDETYYGVETVTFDTGIEGLQQTFTKGIILEGTEIDLNLAEGDQILSAPEGFLIKEATIKKPESLIPENIAEGIDIAGIIGTHKGGGGGLATGAFWETESMGSVSKYNQTWFDCNGERYAFSLTYTGGGNSGTIYKWTDEAWTSLLTSKSINAYNNGENAFAFALPSGKTYIFNREQSGANWYVFDGASFQSAPHAMPGKIYSACIHNGLITAYFVDIGSIYSYSESDGWSLIAKISDKTYDSYYMESVNGELYVIKSNTVYKVVGGSLTQIGTTYRFSKTLGVNGNCIIYLAQTGYTAPDMIRGYDVVENVDSLLGYGMGVQYGYMPASNFSDGQARCLVLKDGKGTYNVYSHKLHIVQ